MTFSKTPLSILGSYVKLNVNDAKHNNGLPISRLSLCRVLCFTMPNVCRYAECRYGECRGAGPDPANASQVKIFYQDQSCKTFYGRNL